MDSEDFLDDGPETNDAGEPLADWDLPWTQFDTYLMQHPVSPVRLATGLPTLDRALGGGIPVGSLVTLQGAPHAGKTSLAIQIALRQAMGSAADCYFYMPDEGARGTCVRAAQGMGFDRGKIAAWDSEEMVRYGVALVETRARLRILDPDDERVTLEKVLSSVKKRQYGEERPVIFVFDSTQTLRAGEEAEAERLRIGYIMEQLKKATRAWDCIVLNISHVNRSAYRNKRSEDNIQPLAGGAESATIERQSDVIVHLDGNITKVVTGQVVKNRVGEGQPTWQMRFDLPRATFTEIDMDAAEDEAARAAEQAAQRAHESLMDELERVIAADAAQGASHAGLPGSFLEQRVGGRRERVRAALRGLADAGRVVARPGPKNATLWGLP